MDIQSYYCNGIRFQVKRLRGCKWPWIWKASKTMSGRCYSTIKAARAAAQSYLTKFGDT